jgi:TP53 regulating kinase-like protein
MKIIQQGAEAKIMLNQKNNIVKDRIKKNYRIPEIDNKLRTRRTRAEIKLLIKASKIINCPKVFSEPGKGKTIHMEFINGKKLSDSLNKFPLEKQKQILNQIGESIAKLHDAEIIHGDLTTSNMIFKDKKIFLIDFGLGFISHKFEDKAVDLHVLKQALEAKHFKNWETLFKEFEKEYKKSKDSKIVLERLKAVEKRGRYKH